MCMYTAAAAGSAKAQKKQAEQQQQRQQQQRRQSQQPPVHYSLLKTVCVLQQKLISISLFAPHRTALPASLLISLDCCLARSHVLTDCFAFLQFIIKQFLPAVAAAFVVVVERFFGCVCSLPTALSLSIHNSLPTWPSLKQPKASLLLLLRKCVQRA